MPFDTQTRNRLASFVGKCRKLLCGDFKTPGGEMARLLAHYGIQDTGDCFAVDTLTHLDEPGRETARTLRAILEHKQSNAPKAKVWKKFDPAVYDLIQEQGFTVLNRLCALRMAEERQLVFPCVSKGLQSDGFQLFEYHTGKANAEITPEHRYQHFLFSLFDELSLDLGSLFDRFSPQALLFPGTQALAELLEELNDPELSALWGEDETIGWIYQYWNSKEERKAMRDASPAPRNSRELAVRNQFFTPRYVVEFLTDNTLGRIWYEMTKGQTRLAVQCRYLVRRPTENFLGEGEDAPEQPATENEQLSQEELLLQPVHIPHRPVKDPREIRLLDPACGSMHFGLYAFDLFEAIYEEAWDKGHCPSLQEAYREKADYLRDVPRLIIEHNIHGVDIDPRAVQIAGLSLWLRAQKTWKDAAERPRVRRSNIVCAEPMPGSDAMLEDFVKTLGPPLLGELVRTVFEKMQLAGEAGTLLKIEEEIRSAIDEAKVKWKRSGDELPGLEADPASSGLRSLASDFWNTAEERIYATLRDYAESAEAGDYQRRLFAEDAAHGFAFIDLCRKRYDAVVMNPPFGEESLSTEDYFRQNYVESGRDIAATFVERAIQISSSVLVGCIVTRALLISVRLSDFRIRNLLSPGNLDLLSDLGSGVLDAAVEASAMILNSTSRNRAGIAFDLIDINANERGPSLLRSISAVNESALLDGHSGLFNNRTLAALPDSVITGWIPIWLSQLFSKLEKLEPSSASVIKGLITGDDFRFVRLRQEVPSLQLQNKDWIGFAKGGGFSPYYSEQHLAIWWNQNGAEIKENASSRYGSETRTIKNQHLYETPGIGYPMRSGVGFSARPLVSGLILADDEPLIISRHREYRLKLLAYLNSTICIGLLKIWQGGIRGRYQWISTSLQSLPVPDLSLIETADSTISLLIQDVAKLSADEECSCNFTSPPLFSNIDSLSSNHKEHQCYFSNITDEIRELHELVDADCTKSLGCRESDRAALLDLIFTEEETPSFYLHRDKSIDCETYVSLIHAYAIGCIFGRWDIRYATGERQPPELPDTFDPLPICPPGMLQNADGLPAAPSDVPGDYPLPITWPGILVSDPGHPEDIVARFRDALAAIWGDRSAAIEQEACEILGVRTLRDYFAEKKSGGKFFKNHLKRYSKSRRQAPIYWPLSTESGTYTLWIYYHRLTANTLYTAVTQFIEPKQEEAQGTFAKLNAKTDRSKAEDKELEGAQLLVAELATFRESLLAIAKFWKPNLNDGVQITAAPLWKHFRLKTWQKTLKDTWGKLENGNFDWAHLAHSIWPKRVIQKCIDDRSLAIAHGHDEALWAETTDAKGKSKWQTRQNAEAIAEELISQQTV